MNPIANFAYLLHWIVALMVLALLFYLLLLAIQWTAHRLLGLDYFRELRNELHLKRIRKEHLSKKIGVEE